MNQPINQLTTVSAKSTPRARTAASTESDCEICNGEGLYPVIDRQGFARYAIRCPECGGSGHAS